MIEKIIIIRRIKRGRKIFKNTNTRNNNDHIIKIITIIIIIIKK